MELIVKSNMVGMKSERFKLSVLYLVLMELLKFQISWSRATWS